MERELNPYLRESERVLWRGKPAAFPLLDKGTKLHILCKWILTAAIFGGTMLYQFSRYGQGNSVLICLVSLCTVLIVISPMVERQNLKGYKYWITNQRAILMTQDKNFYYMDLSNIDDVRLVSDEAYEDCLVLGSCIFEEIHKKLIWRACHPKEDFQTNGDMDQAQGLVFYCVRNGRTAMKLLEQKRLSQLRDAAVEKGAGGSFPCKSNYSNGYR